MELVACVTRCCGTGSPGETGSGILLQSLPSPGFHLANRQTSPENPGKIARIEWMSSRRLRGVQALQDLHAALLVGAQHQVTLLCEGGGLDVQAADGAGDGVEVGVVAVEPV